MSDETIAGRYRLVEPLGRGAMSSVWLAEDAELERLVAVKLLAPTADRARFEREARAAASLAHPNLCALYDYGEADGKPYMVLEYLPNGSLEQRLLGAPLVDVEALRIAGEIAAGLAHAHGRGLVHRDLKPANVLFDGEGRAKIADFGIARMGAGGGLTEAGTVLGTASYISPEQAGGLPAAPASDVYSFGVILFRMLTGRLPFSAANTMDVVRMHRDDAPPRVADFRRDAPTRLEALADAALAKDPAARPPDGAALVRELRGGEYDAPLLGPVGRGGTAGEAGATQVMRTRGMGRRRSGRRGSIFLLAFAGLALLGVGVAVAVVTTGRESGNSGGSSLPGLSLPKLSTAAGRTPTSTPTTATTTAQAASTPPVTAQAPSPSTTETTTAGTSTAPAGTAPGTTAPGTTTAFTTAQATVSTAPGTTDQTTTGTSTTTGQVPTDTMPATTSP